jgi:hypothetical protein
VKNFVPADGIQVGQGATYHIGSDRYPYTVVEILSPRSVVLQEDNYRCTDYNSQTYEYTPNPDASRTIVTLRKDGVWRKKGDTKGSGYFGFYGRNAYQDPSF